MEIFQGCAWVRQPTPSSSSKPTHQSLLGHTATFYQGDKLIIFGGENEHRTFLSDIVIFDLTTAHWSQPSVSGPIPRGRSRHGAALYKDKLFIVGGLMGDNSVVDDVCYLDLTTLTWSRAWSFVRKFDHAAWVWGEKLWVFGGLGPDMGRDGEICWLDLRADPTFQGPLVTSLGGDRADRGRDPHGPHHQALLLQHSMDMPGMSPNGAHANASYTMRPPPTPAASGISSLSFISSSHYPPQASGTHFYVYSSNTLLDFVTPASTIRPNDCGLAVLDLEDLRWQRLVEGTEMFDRAYRWHYCAVNEDGTKAWLLGCTTDLPTGPDGSFEDCLGDVLAIDLRRFGLLGDANPSEPGLKDGRGVVAGGHGEASLGGLGTDLARVFDRRPESGSGADFIIAAIPDELEPTSPDVERNDVEVDDDDNEDYDDPRPVLVPSTATSRSPGPSKIIHVHLLVLQTRWPHFRRLYASGMVEARSMRMHIPEPYRVVRAFLFYLYTDSISRHREYGIDLDVNDVAGLLVMSNLYDLPALRHLCVHRLDRELDVKHAAIVWERAWTANEVWLRRRAATFCLQHWGRLVRTDGFRSLDRDALGALCEEVDTGGRVVGGIEPDPAGSLAVSGSSRVGLAAWTHSHAGRHTTGVEPTTVIQVVDEMETEEDEDHPVTVPISSSP